MRRKPHTGRGGSRHVGRTRIAAAKILSRGLGLQIDPEDIAPATGSYRTCQYHDVFRWELHRVDMWAGCWETLTNFVKQSRRLGGCHIKDGEIWPGPQKD
jgi:hypothetical protein